MSTRFIGTYAVFTGMGGTQRQGVRVHAKKGLVPSPSVEFGGNTRTSRVCGRVEEVDGGAEKEKRARCLGMFQLRRPL